MCATCGCDGNNSLSLHETEHEHHHDHPHTHQKTIINAELDILHQNNLLAERNRGFLKQRISLPSIWSVHQVPVKRVYWKGH